LLIALLLAALAVLLTDDSKPGILQSADRIEVIGAW